VHAAGCRARLACGREDSSCTYKVCSSLTSALHQSTQLHSLPSSVSRLSNSLAPLYRLLSDFALTNRTAMCLRCSIDRFAIPCIYEVEGITTMPVCYLSIIQPVSLDSKLTVTGARTPLPRVLGAWRHGLGHSWQMLPAVRHTC
jgi:hypothetical protein